MLICTNSGNSNNRIYSSKDRVRASHATFSHWLRWSVRHASAALVLLGPAVAHAAEPYECIREQTVNAALCGTTTVTDAAQCGFTLGD
jgi:hypothetical protein